MILQLKNIDYIKESSENEDFKGDILSQEEKQFLDLLSDIMTEDIINSIKKAENEE